MRFFFRFTEPSRSLWRLWYVFLLNLMTAAFGGMTRSAPLRTLQFPTRMTCCSMGVLMCLILEAALVHDSVLLVAHRFVDCTRSDAHFQALLGAADADEHGPRYRVACRPWRSGM